MGVSVFAISVDNFKTRHAADSEQLYNSLAEFTLEKLQKKGLHSLLLREILPKDVCSVMNFGMPQSDPQFVRGGRYASTNGCLLSQTIQLASITAKTNKRFWQFGQPAFVIAGFDPEALIRRNSSCLYDLQNQYALRAIIWYRP